MTVVVNWTRYSRSVYSTNIGCTILHIINILTLFNWWIIITVLKRTVVIQSSCRRHDYIFHNRRVLKTEKNNIIYEDKVNAKLKTKFKKFQPNNSPATTTNRMRNHSASILTCSTFLSPEITHLLYRPVL